MVDRESRTKLAELIRHLVAGRITNDEFEDSFPLRSADPAVWEVFSCGAWALYSDLWQYRLTGRYRLPKEARREVSRWILYLKTDLEYEWPRLSLIWSILFLVGNLFSVGLLGFGYRRYLRLCGDWEVWPFQRRSDYEAALEQPPYLGGTL